MQEHLEVQEKTIDYRIKFKGENSILKPFKNHDPKITIACKCCQNKHPNLISKNGTFKLYECEGCGFIFSATNNRLLPFEINLNSPEKATSAETKEYLKRAIEWLPSKSLNILNIGYNGQHLLDFLHKKGHKVLSVRDLQELFSSSDEENSRRKKKYDVILTCNSLNQISEPVAAFHKMFGMLKEFGLHVIYMDMHISTDELINKFKNSEKNKPAHISFFRYKTIETIMDQLGHDIVYVNPKMIMIRKGV